MWYIMNYIIKTISQAFTITVSGPLIHYYMVATQYPQFVWRQKIVLKYLAQSNIDLNKIFYYMP